MGLSLSAKTPGSPDNSFAWLLHNSGTALATGFTVSLGDGTDTLLYLSGTEVGIKGAGGRHALVSAATATRTWSLSNTSGTIVPDNLVLATADTSNSTTSDIDAVGLSFTPDASGIYEFEAWIICRSAAAATGVQVTVTGPGQVSFPAWISRGPTNVDSLEVIKYGTASNPAFTGLNMPVLNQDYIVHIKGTFKVTGTPSSAVKVVFKSEVAASSVTIKADSYFRARKLN